MAWSTSHARALPGKRSRPRHHRGRPLPSRSSPTWTGCRIVEVPMIWRSKRRASMRFWKSVGLASVGLLLLLETNADAVETIVDGIVAQSYNVRYFKASLYDDQGYNVSVIWFDPDDWAKSTEALCELPYIRRVAWGTLGDYLKWHEDVEQAANNVIFCSDPYFRLDHIRYIAKSDFEDVTGTVRIMWHFKGDDHTQEKEVICSLMGVKVIKETDFDTTTKIGSDLNLDHSRFTTYMCPNKD